jgi:alkanesulfonate monooxygenase SsuD/methylene tetrahydromethanopterin reductase-like flavin-dependent oxidoreductase (luciferase family)
MKLKFGLALPNNEARKVAELAQLAEQTGWDGIFLGDFIWCEDPMVALAAAAMTTHQIRLGTMLTPAPIRRPWKVASESVAVDRLSNGRLTLGLGTGAVWMGWQAFPDEVTDVKIRAEMLDETIDILTLMYQGKQFDYDGKHYHLKLTQLDEMHYPPKPIQQPRIPLWIPGIWPRKKTMQRALQCEGVLAEKWTAEGSVDITPADVREIKAYVDAHRPQDKPFDIVVGGKVTHLDPAERQDKMREWVEAGATWWVEVFWGDPEDIVPERIRQGPPKIS